ncbi:hypothetical protein BDZ89DRAFT_1148960 [Hymenopellis radicata]|nr:hypothetical protein BDZ89DRAFT_1148960 [Hymenopellis radicata]
MSFQSRFGASNDAATVIPERDKRRTWGTAAGSQLEDKQEDLHREPAGNYDHRLNLFALHFTTTSIVRKDGATTLGTSRRWRYGGIMIFTFTQSFPDSEQKQIIESSDSSGSSFSSASNSDAGTATSGVGDDYQSQASVSRPADDVHGPPVLGQKEFYLSLNSATRLHWGLVADDTLSLRSRLLSLYIATEDIQGHQEALETQGITHRFFALNDLVALRDRVLFSDRHDTFARAEMYGPLERDGLNRIMIITNILRESPVGMIPHDALVYSVVLDAVQHHLGADIATFERVDQICNVIRMTFNLAPWTRDSWYAAHAVPADAKARDGDGL